MNRSVRRALGSFSHRQKEPSITLPKGVLEREITLCMRDEVDFGLHR